MGGSSGLRVRARRKARLALTLLWEAQASGSPAQGGQRGLQLGFPRTSPPPKRRYPCLQGLEEEKARGSAKTWAVWWAHNTPHGLCRSPALGAEVGGEHGTTASSALPARSALRWLQTSGENPLFSHLIATPAASCTCTLPVLPRSDGTPCVPPQTLSSRFLQAALLQSLALAEEEEGNSSSTAHGWALPPFTASCPSDITSSTTQTFPGHHVPGCSVPEKRKA